jgi:hypothetical protein
MREGYGLGGKKVNRVGVNLSNQYNIKLNRLATSCNMRPAELAGYIIEQMLDNTSFINRLQDEKNTIRAYRVLPLNSNGKLVYMN